MRLHRMPSISSYADCVSFYASARRWKSPARYGSQTQIGEPKKIDKAGKPYKSVRQVRVSDPLRATLPEGIGYAWRYHDTDVVTWVSETDIVVTPWASMSTTAFMEALLPSGFNVYMHHSLGCMLGLRPRAMPEWPTLPYDDPAYEPAVQAWCAARDEISETTKWFLVPECQPVRLHREGDTWSVLDSETVDVPQVNAKKAHAARREFDTTGFAAWLDAMFALNRHVTVRDAQAHALARAAPACSPENIHANSDLGLEWLRYALRNPELYWSIMASPHLRPASRYSRGGRIASRTHAEEIEDWIKTMTHAALLAAYRKHEAVEIRREPYIASLHACTLVHRLRQRWEIERFSWPKQGVLDLPEPLLKTKLTSSTAFGVK